MPVSSPVKLLKIASRKSALALWQSQFIKARLEKLYSNLTIEIIGMTTQGDKILDVPLAKIGGKGLFVKELETSMLNGHTDIAVHSMKDVPMVFPEGLELAAICEREDPLDAFVSNRFDNIESLPNKAIVGTSSLRRQSQLAALRPDLDIRPLRGNVNTRLGKLDEGDYDAIILAASGLKRLGFDTRIRNRLTPIESLPAVGQGALGIECRSVDNDIKQLLKPLIHVNSNICVKAERAMNYRLQGGCQVPIAGYATINNGQITLTGLVASIDGRTILRSSSTGSIEHPELLGERVAEQLLEQGAEALLSSIDTQ